MVSLVYQCTFLMGYTEAVSLGKVTQHCQEVRTVSGHRWESTRKHITNHETLKLCGHCRLYSSWHLRLFEFVLACVALRDRTGLFTLGWARHPSVLTMRGGAYALHTVVLKQTLALGLADTGSRGK